MRLGCVVIHVPDVPAALAFTSAPSVSSGGLLPQGANTGNCRPAAPRLPLLLKTRSDQAPAAVEIGLVTDQVSAPIPTKPRVTLT